ERDVVHGDVIAVALDEVVDFDDVHAPSVVREPLRHIGRPTASRAATRWSGASTDRWTSAQCRTATPSTSISGRPAVASLTIRRTWVPTLDQCRAKTIVFGWAAEANRSTVVMYTPST